MSRERITKMDDGISQLKINNLTENLSNCTIQLSMIQSKYHNDINELRPKLDEKEAEVNQNLFNQSTNKFF